MLADNWFIVPDCFEITFVCESVRVSVRVCMRDLLKTIHMKWILFSVILGCGLSNKVYCDFLPKKSKAVVYC